jgi:hypothetical protein
MPGLVPFGKLGFEKKKLIEKLATYGAHDEENKINMLDTTVRKQTQITLYDMSPGLLQTTGGRDEPSIIYIVFFSLGGNIGKRDISIKDSKYET